MTMLDLLILLIYFLLVAFAGLHISALSLAVVVAVMMLVRFIGGERPAFLQRSAVP